MGHVIRALSRFGTGTHIKEVPLRVARGEHLEQFCGAFRDPRYATQDLHRRDACPRASVHRVQRNAEHRPSMIPLLRRVALVHRPLRVCAWSPSASEASIVCGTPRIVWLLRKIRCIYVLGQSIIAWFARTTRCTIVPIDHRTTTIEGLLCLGIARGVMRRRSTLCIRSRLWPQKEKIGIDAHSNIISSEMSRL